MGYFEDLFPKISFRMLDIATTSIAKHEKFLPLESQFAELHHQVSMRILFDLKFVLYQLKGVRSHSPIQSPNR